MTELENKILTALREKNTKMINIDADLQKEHDEYIKKANNTDDNYWKEDYKNHAAWVLHFQHHGYEFVEEWKNTISTVMYNKIYHQWHSAVPGKHGTGHAAFVTSELTADEKEKITKIFNGLVKQGYLRLSKSGYKAKLVK